MDKTLEIIGKYQLEYYLKVLLTENKGNTNPYHNFHHTITMMRRVYEIARIENVDETNIRLMLIAALFHDFNHSGGKFKNDSDNIDYALDAFLMDSQENVEDELDIGLLICSTQYPYNADYEPTFLEKILRDADML